MRRRQQKARLLLEELEPRILHSADVATLVPVVPTAQLVEMRVVDTAQPAGSEESRAAAIEYAHREIVFVDAAVEGYQALVDDLEATRGASLAVYVLDHASDGVSQITGILAAQHDLAAIHLISHGAEGVLELGSGVLDRAALERNAGALAAWSRALTPDADLLLYGCDVAAGPDGQAFVDALARLTGADVAASTDATGSAAKGGDWTLEYSAGRIETAAPMSAAFQQAWQGTLAYVETAPYWNPTVTGSWETKDLTAAYGIPANAVVDIAVYNTASNATHTAGVRAVGSSLDRTFAINRTASGGESVEMMVQTDASGRIQTFGTDTPNVYFSLLGYWTNGTYVETAGSFTVGADATWESHSLSSFGVTAGSVAEVVITNTANNSPQVGVRSEGSSLARATDIRNRSIGTGVETMTLLVNAGGTAAANIEAYAQSDRASVTYNVVGYWSTAPGAYTETFTSLGAPSVNSTWQTKSLTAAGVPVNAIAGVLMTNNDTTSGVYEGLRPVGSATGRLELIDAAGSGAGGGQSNSRMLVTTDGSGNIEWYSGNIAQTAFTLTGYFIQNTAPTLSGSENLTAILEDPGVNAGTAVSALLAGHAADADANPIGIAVTAVDDTNGAWQYSTNGGGAWSAFGSASESSARLLSSSAQVRFAPNADWNGTVATGLTFRAWDQTSGTEGTAVNVTLNGGPRAFSSATATAAITVTAVNDAPAGADKTVTVLEDSTHTFVAADFGFTDAVDGNTLLNVKIGTVPGAGALMLSGAAVTAGQSISAANITAGNLKFTPATNANGPAYASFTFQVQDDGGVANGGVDLAAARTITIDVTAVNDAPVLVGANDLGGINRNPTSNPGTLVGDLLAGHLTDADTDAAQGIAVTGVDNTNGAWQFTTDGGTTWTAFGAPGTAAARLLAADVYTSVRFVPNANYSGIVAGLTFKAWDQTAGAAGATADTTASGGATPFSAASATASIVVTATNTAPTLTGGNNLTAINEDAAGNGGTLVSALIAANTGDVDPGALTGIAVTAVDNTNGTWQYSLNSGTLWTSFGSPSATAARLLAADASTFVRFVPNADWNGTVANGITFRAWDRSAGVAGGTADTSGITGTYRDDFSTAAYTNNDGTLTWSGPWVEADNQGGGAASGRFRITSGTLAVQAEHVGDNLYREVNLIGATGASLSFMYGSGLKGNAELHVQVSSDGGATYTTLAGGIFDAVTNTSVGSRTYDITSSIASNTRIRFLVVDSEGGADKNAFWVGDIQITDSARNGGSTAFSTATASSSVTVNAVNDVPVRTAGSVNNLTVLEDASATSLGLGTLAYAVGGGVDEAAQTLTYTVTAVPAAALGTITLADGTTAVRASTTYSLAQLQGMQFKAASNANGGPATFSWSVADSGGTANGGVDTLAQSLTVSVTSVNDAPAGANKTVTTLEDTAYTFTAADFGFTDAADSNALLNVKVATLPGAGTLTLSGVSVTAGQSVSAANIAAGELKFAPASNAKGAGYASFTFQVQDDGGVANGGADLDPTPRTMTVDVTSVNDAPGGANKTVTMLEDTAYTFVVADFGFTDAADGNALLNVKIATLPAAGSLTLSGLAVTAGQSISAASITSGNLVFTPAPDARRPGYAAFTFQVQDDGGALNGGIDLDPVARTITVDVTSVNDAPSGASNTVTTREDTAYVFAAADFGFSDVRDANVLLNVKIGTLPAAGSLTLSGVAVTAGQSISAANITAGNLRFNPVSNANGAGYASFTFQVQDDGGTANGGIDLDPVARTVTVDVTSVNDAPVGANNTVTTLEDTAYTFGVADFGFSDPVESNALFNVRIAALPTAGTLTLSGVAVTAGQSISAVNIAAGNLRYAPAANANGAGSASFTFQVQDDGGVANGGVDLDPTPRTITIYVTSVNDAPSGANRTVTTLEDTAYTFGVADFGFTDAADGNALLNVKIGAIPAVGSLTLSGVAVTAGQSVSAADINAGNLRFTPVANANGAGYASFTFQVQDSGGTANGGIDLDAIARTMTVGVLAVNDAPGGAHKSVTTLEDIAYTFGVADFGFSDPVESNALLNVSIAALPTAGTLTLSGVAVAAGQSISAADIASGNLVFTPAANANGAAYASFTFQVQDDGGVANGGVDLDPTARTLTVAVTSVNDAPSGADQTVTTREDTAYVFAAADFGFSDVRDANALLNVKIGALPAAGSLTLSGAAVTAGQSISAANITAGNLRFTPVSNANGAGYASFTFQVQDDGGVANGGIDLDPVARLMTVDVTAVNHAPAGANNTVTTLEDTAYTFGVADFGFSDPVESNALLNVKIGALSAAGTLTLSGVAVTAGQSISAVNIAAGNLRYAPAANAYGAGYASFTFQVQDDGGTLSGGVDLDPVARTMTVDVTAVTDAPSGANKTVTTLEDTAYTFGVADFGFADAADGNALLNVKIGALPAAGTLTLAGVAVGANQFVAAASIAAGDLRFTPAANASGAPYASFTFQVQDDGGTANGGADLDAIPRTMTVAVTPLNDAPAGTSTTVTTLEDTPYTFTAADFGFTDADDAASASGANALGAVTIGSIPLTGTLAYDFVPVTAGQIVSAADLAAGKLMFIPALDGNGAGYATFSFQVQDDGGVANGGVDRDPLSRTMTVAVTSVNDAPSGAGRTVTTLEDTAYVFAAADFGFSDAPDGNALAGVRIASVPAAGTLTLSGVAVTANQFVSAASLAAGDLVFAPAADANGALYAAFTFRVQDDGGTSNGGVDLDPVVRTMSVAVTSVNDAPVGMDHTAATLEDTAYRFVLADFGFSDARDGNAIKAVKVTTVPGAGTLTLAGVAVGAGQTISAGSIAAGDFMFTPGPNDNGTAYGGFTFQVQDDGGTSGGGVDLDTTARTMRFDVAAVNDAPSGTDATVSTPEGKAHTLSAGDFGFGDAADRPANALLNVRVIAVSGSGVFTLAGTAVTAGQVISAASITAGDLTFTPAGTGGGPGYASLAFQVRDDGGTAAGGVDADATPRTLTVDVKRNVAVQVPDAPIIVTQPAPETQTQPAQSDDTAPQTPQETRTKATLARIAAELDAAAARALAVPMIAADGQVGALPVAPDVRAEAVNSIAPASSSAGRRDSGAAAAITVPLLFEARPDSAAPAPIAIPVSTSGRSAAAAAAGDAAESSGDRDDAKQQAVALLTIENGVRASAIIVSAGMVTWTLQGAGLIASLLTSAPAWRHIDPLPVLAPETEKPDWGDSDGDSQREEDAADRLWLGETHRSGRTV